MAFKTDERTVLYLLIPPELKMLLRARSEDNNRSMTAEVTRILWRSVRDGYRLRPED